MEKYTIQNLVDDANRTYDALVKNDQLKTFLTREQFIEGFCVGSFHGFGLSKPTIPEIARTALTWQTNPPDTEIIHDIANKVEQHYISIAKSLPGS